MKRLLFLLMAAGLLLSLCACGMSYTAVPELKLSWGMTKEEILKTSENSMDELESDGTAYLRSHDGEVLPKVNGMSITWYRCYFDENGGLKQVDVKFLEEDPSIVFNALKSKYGNVTSSGYTFGVWEKKDVVVVDNVAFGVQGFVSYYSPDIW